MNLILAPPSCEGGYLEIPSRGGNSTGEIRKWYQRPIIDLKIINWL